LNLNKEFWELRYQNNQTAWDLGVPSPSLTAYFDQLEDKDIRILIPGAGNAYEIEYLWKQGFKNVDVLDISSQPLDNLQKRLPDFPKENIFMKDFFHHQGGYDLIVEQTFFCALNPNLRLKYVAKMHELLNEEGKLVGLLFNRYFNEDHPPYGGSISEYHELFNDSFEMKTMETSYNSIEPRRGSEVFFIVIKK